MIKSIDETKLEKINCSVYLKGLEDEIELNIKRGMEASGYINDGLRLGMLEYEAQLSKDFVELIKLLIPLVCVNDILDLKKLAYVAFAVIDSLCEVF